MAVGNAAGEAHPIIAEGISMAMQSAWLLCDRLAREKHPLLNASLREVGRDYSRAWRRTFAPRMRVAACFAHLAMRDPRRRAPSFSAAWAISVSRAP